MPRLDATREELAVFAQEAEEQLALLDHDITRLERDQADPALLQDIFRAAHTLKGSSAMLGYAPMATLTHAMEDAFEALRAGNLSVTQQLIDALLAALDGLRLLVAAAGTDADAPADAPALAGAVRHAARGADSSTRETSTLRVRISALSEWVPVRMLQALQAAGRMGEIVDSTPSAQEIESGDCGYELVMQVRCGDIAKLRAAIEGIDEVELVDAVQTQAVRAAAPPNGAPAPSPATVRIDVSRLDVMMDLTGELLIDRTRIDQTARRLLAKYAGDEDVQALEQIASHIDKIADDLNGCMLQARMLPVSVIFRTLPRLVREAARATNKDISFEISGEDTEIDRTMVERVKDPLVHLLRNAVDHGIEPEAERSAAGKPPAGAVRISARHEEGRIIIDVSDDGRGIDHARIRDVAVRRRLVTRAQARRLSDDEALDLLFAPGFSTRDEATELSGRGVGLDVVRSAVEAMGGSVVVIAQEPGTTFRLSLPLTLATFRGLLVVARGRTYAIPLASVQETGWLRPKSVRRVVDREVVELRGDVLPLLRLGDAWSRTDAGEGTEQYMVVVRAGAEPAALAVDRLVHHQDIVVKPLGSVAGKRRGLAGASILGDGGVALIVDVPALLKAA